MLRPYLFPKRGPIDPWSLARALAESTLQGTRLTEVLGILRSRDLRQISQLGVLPDRAWHDGESRQLLAERQIRTLFQKNEALTSKDAQSVAWKLFQASEKRCRITNRRLDYFSRSPSRLDREVRGWLRCMRRDIASLLGEVDYDLLEEIPKRIRLTSGATEDRTRSRSFPFQKISGKIRLPSRTVPYAQAYLLSKGVGLDECRFTIVDSNTVVMVPKNWRTMRTIAKEPTHSLPFQLALDSIVKTRLRRWGVDLSDQGRNQELARLGSIDGSLATLDLEAASDTLSINAVALLLPDAWFSLFGDFRSRFYKSPFGSGAYAKFSSMGNGYTFTLETMIFSAACRAVGAKTWSVYGDDIVLESSLAPSLCRLLSFLGFRVNKEKSFIDPTCLFRESCGCDWFMGQLVTPFYLRELPDVERDRAALCHIVNSLLVRDHSFLWDAVIRLIREKRYAIVPENSDTTSGIFVPVATAYKMGKLYYPKAGKYGGLWSPVFRGYRVRQLVRSTRGWRSLLLWHICASSKPGLSVTPPLTNNRSSSGYLLNYRMGGPDKEQNESYCSSVVIGTSYAHGVRRFCPLTTTVRRLSPVWGEYLELNLPRKP